MFEFSGEIYSTSSREGLGRVVSPESHGRRLQEGILTGPNFSPLAGAAEAAGSIRNNKTVEAADKLGTKLYRRGIELYYSVIST